MGFLSPRFHAQIATVYGLIVEPLILLHVFPSMNHKFLIRQGPISRPHPDAVRPLRTYTSVFVSHLIVGQFNDIPGRIKLAPLI